MSTEQEALAVELRLIAGFMHDPRPRDAVERASAMLRKLVAEREAQQRELIGLRARLDRAIKAAEEHFGEDAIRYKFSLMKDGRTRNIFPGDCDGKWFALQRADNDAHIGLCDRITQLEAERKADRAAMRRAVEAWDTTVLPVANDGCMQEAMEIVRQRLKGTT